MDKSFMVADVMKGMMDGNIPSKEAEANLLDEMIREGKLMYYLDLVLPEEEDSTKMGFTSAQLQWCRDNEEEIWKFLAGEDLLFSTKAEHLRKYLSEAPYSYGMPEESPGRVAMWVGWQIVRSYMVKNENITLQQLFDKTDGLDILNSSNYKPDKEL
jgi:hypothetical protein